MDYIRVGDTYYMVSTTMFFNPGVPIMKSKDLVSWELCSYVYDTLERGLGYLQNFAALDMLAQNHAKKRRFKRVFPALFGKLQTGVRGVCGEQKLVCRAEAAYAEYYLVTFGLVYLVYAPADYLAVKLVYYAAYHYSVKCHISPFLYFCCVLFPLSYHIS